MPASQALVTVSWTLVNPGPSANPRRPLLPLRCSPQVQVNPFATLFEAAWLPPPPGTHQDRPQSPERIATAATAGSPSSGGAAASPAAPANGPARPVGYVPPHARRGVVGSNGAQAPQFSLAYDANDRPGRVTVGASGAIRPASAKPATPGALGGGGKVGCWGSQGVWVYRGRFCSVASMWGTCTGSNGKSLCCMLCTMPVAKLCCCLVVTRSNRDCSSLPERWPW